MRALLIFVTLVLGASSEAAQITEAGLILETPSPWQKEKMQGEDS